MGGGTTEKVGVQEGGVVVGEQAMEARAGGGMFGTGSYT